MPSAYAPFLTAVSGAAAALIGLLFVAVTVDPERVRHQAEADRQLNAALAFCAFVDPLFVALSSLLPGGGAAGTARVVGVIGFLITLTIGRTVLVRRRSGGRPRISPSLLALTALVYAAQVAAAQVLFGAPGRAWAENDLCASLMGLLAVGILRSWELLGMGRGAVAVMRDPTGPAPASQASDGAHPLGP